MAKAKIGRVGGSTAIVVDGQTLAPMYMTAECRDTAYLRRLGEAGMRLFFVAADTDWVRPGDPTFTPAKREWAYFIRPDMSVSGTADFARDMRTLFDAIPDAYVIVRLNVSPSVEWINAHPEEQIRYSDGEGHPVVCTSASRYEPVDGMHSLASEKWREEGKRAMYAFLDWLKTTPYYARTVGVFLCAAGTSEWYYPVPTVLENGAVCDFCDPFRRAFSAFLRRKYGTEENLRAAWRMPDASFDEPKIPTLAERDFIYGADRRHSEIAHNWVVKVKEKETAPPPLQSDGVFVDLKKNAHVADFYDAWSEATAETVLSFARAVKEYDPDFLTGAFYGALGCSEYFDSSTSTGTRLLLDSGYVDFLSSPGVYTDRAPGGIVALRQMQDSFRLRGRVFINEDDSRTHRTAPTAQRVGFGEYTVKDSLNTLKRDFGRDLCEDIGGWWFDMGGDWYDDPEICALFKRQQEIAKKAYAADRTKHNDIALIYSLDSIHRVSLQTNVRILDHFRTSDLGRIGAPVDYYFLEDMARPDMPDYNMYVMVNDYAMTADQRQSVQRKAAKNHALVLWLYAPGYQRTDGVPTQGAEEIERTTGIRVRPLEGVRYPHFFVDPASHPALERTTPSRLYGYIEREILANVSLGTPVVQREFLSPAFAVCDPDAAVLGRAATDGEPYLAMKETDGYISVFCTAQTVQADLLRSLAAYAGAHIYSDTDDVLYASERFVCLHASTDGEKTLHFKRPTCPTEVYEEKTYGENVTSLTVFMHRGETKMWELCD